VEDVEHKLKSQESYWLRKKWLIVYNGLVDPRTAALIAKQIGVSCYAFKLGISNEQDAQCSEQDAQCSEQDARTTARISSLLTLRFKCRTAYQ